jgi:hypothetical protein
MLLLSGLLGAIIGAFVTLGFNLWKVHRDERGARCDELCAAIRDVAQIASTYWAQAYNSDDNEQKIAEAKLLSAQILVEGLSADFTPYLPEASQRKIEQALSELVDTLTGGAFSEPKRPVDLERLTRAPQHASLTIVAVRHEYRASLPFHRLVAAFHLNRRRSLDMPTRC